MNTKTCGSCGNTKDVGEFSRDRSKNDGLCSRCKECARAAGSKWAKLNRLRHNERNRAWRDANPDKVSATQRKYYEANRGKILERGNAWRTENREQHLARRREWAAANRDKVSESNRKYYDANPHVFRARAANHRAAAAGVDGVVTTQDIINLWTEYDDLCAYCGSPAEDLDHYIPLALGGPNSPDNLRPACAHCNGSKGDKHPEDWLSEAV